MADRPIIFSGPMVRALLENRKTQTRRMIKGEVRDPPSIDAVNQSNEVRHDRPYLDAYCSETRTPPNPRGMSRQWCWWTRDDRQCLPTFDAGYRPGDQLWVREAWRTFISLEATSPADLLRVHGGPRRGAGVKYKVDAAHLALSACDERYFDTGHDNDMRAWGRLRPSIHMPRWASRLTLTVADVRVRRLQEISEEDAIAEGVQRAPGGWWSGAEGQAGATAVAAYALLWNSIYGHESWNSNPWVAAITFSAERRNIDCPTPASMGGP